MSSVEVGRPFEEEEQLEKKQQTEGCESEEEAKPRKIGDAAEDAFDYPDSESETDEDEDEDEDEAEVEQPEKKRPGEGEVAESDEEPKRQKVKGVKDLDFMSQSEISETGDSKNEPEPPFYGGDLLDYDSEDKREEKFLPSHALVYASRIKNQDGRNCHKVPQCHFLQHKIEYYGLPVFELFKVKLILNEDRNRSLLGKLYGAIELLTSSENPYPISFFSVKKENAFPIHLDPGNKSICLPLSFPKAKALTVYSYWLDVKFAFKFEYENNDEAIDVFEEYGDDDGSGNCKGKFVFLSLKTGYLYQYREYTRGTTTEFLAYPNSDIMRVAASYAIYDGAWATVDVIILNQDVNKYYGLIFARPCIFKSRIRLLSVPEKDQMCELPKSRNVALARQVVAVPTFSSLVIAVSLYDQDGKEFVRDKTFFKVLPPGKRDAKHIGKDDVRIQVVWNCGIPDEWTPWLPGCQ